MIDTTGTLTFTTKANVLKELRKTLKTATVLPLYDFQVNDYLRSSETILRNIQQKFSGLIVVRSSAASEDQPHSSNAGCYESVLNVNAGTTDEVKSAVDKVVSSFNNNEPNNSIFIQNMLLDVVMSGVAFTSDLDNLSPYYVINYTLGQETDLITNGSAENAKTLLCHKDHIDKCEKPEIKHLLKTLCELERIYQNSFLDVEFAISSKKDLYIFQVRPIVNKNKDNLYKINLNSTLSKLASKIEKLQRPHHNLLGSKALFGVMADWNPAEMIGIKPRRLALSLYKTLITDKTWAYQRDNYGYRRLRSHPLLISLLGVPYIDIRVDFNSFIPKKLEHNIAEKLVEHYLIQFELNPTWHDKVEFKIVHSCCHFTLDKKLDTLPRSKFSQSDIEQIKLNLVDITNNVISPQSGLFQNDVKKLTILQDRYKLISDSDLSLIDKIYWLIEDCRRYGTLPFAGIARAAFIATQFLNSFEELRIIDSEEKQMFLAGLNTLSKKFKEDLGKTLKGDMGKEKFLELYGHLKPGTYNILSKNYEDNFDDYFSDFKLQPSSEIENSEGIFTFNMEQLAQIDDQINRNGLKLSSGELINFIKQAIEAREYAKLVFTKSIDKVLNMITRLGERCRLTLDDLSYLDINDVLSLFADLDASDLEDYFMRSINYHRAQYQYTRAVKLPSVILKPADVYSFELQEDEPTYITNRSIHSQIVVESDIQKSNVSGKIALLEAADPGYDYLFALGISGLVTKYGGANSHMAIRCAELKIPAIIGVGEKTFNYISKHNFITINGQEKTMKCLQEK